MSIRIPSDANVNLKKAGCFLGVVCEFSSISFKREPSGISASFNVPKSIHNGIAKYFNEGFAYHSGEMFVAKFIGV